MIIMYDWLILLKIRMRVMDLESWYGVEGLITDGADEKFGPGTATFLREAFKQQEVMKAELPKRYGLA